MQCICRHRAGQQLLATQVSRLNQANYYIVTRDFLCKLETNWTPNCLASVACLLARMFDFCKRNGRRGEYNKRVYSVRKDESNTLPFFSHFMVMVIKFTHNTILEFVSRN